jgi:hypothetical protein
MQASALATLFFVPPSTPDHAQMHCPSKEPYSFEMPPQRNRRRLYVRYGTVHNVRKPDGIKTVIDGYLQKY